MEVKSLLNDVRQTRSVLIVIGQVLANPWLDIARAGQFPTWLRDASAYGIRVRHSHGIRPNFIVRSLDRAHEWLRWHGRGRSLIPQIDSRLGSPWLDRVPAVRLGSFVHSDAVAWKQQLVDVYALQRWKVVGSLTQALKEDFTHVYFTTASSYVRVGNLLSVIHDLPLTGVYAGAPFTDAISGTRFASGSSRILSRDVAQAVVDTKERYRNDVMEDVGLGRLIREIGFEFVPLDSVNVSSVEDVRDLSDVEITEHFHFRTKSGNPRQRADAAVMAALHERVVELETSMGLRTEY